MAYDLSGRLVVGVASSALFDLAVSDAVFRQRGEDSYREYQEERIDEPLPPGGAFPFVERLLSLNDLGSVEVPPVEVIVLSKNDPDTGLRVMRPIAHYGLEISRAIFTQGRSPYRFMSALHMALFLSENEADVKEATRYGFAAGRVMGAPAADPADTELRVAFDFDGVLADDSSERIMRSAGLKEFHANEVARVDDPLPEGRLSHLLRGLNQIQDLEEAQRIEHPEYARRVRIAIVTARNAPSHERVVRTLEAWGLRVNDAFFLGGVEKASVLRVLKPHIFFDDQISHLENISNEVPSVHIPFGVANEDE